MATPGWGRGGVAVRAPTSQVTDAYGEGNPRGATPRALSRRTSRTGRTSRTAQITPGGYLEGRASSEMPGRRRGAVQFGYLLSSDRCLWRGYPSRGAIHRALSHRASRTAQITPGGYLEDQASSETPGRGRGGAAVRSSRSSDRCLWRGHPSRGAIPSPVLHACRSRRDHPALCNSNVTRA